MYVCLVFVGCETKYAQLLTLSWKCLKNVNGIGVGSVSFDTNIKTIWRDIFDFILLRLYANLLLFSSYFFLSVSLSISFSVQFYKPIEMGFGLINFVFPMHTQEKHSNILCAYNAFFYGYYCNFVVQIKIKYLPCAVRLLRKTDLRTISSSFIFRWWFFFRSVRIAVILQKNKTTTRERKINTKANKNK